MSRKKSKRQSTKPALAAIRQVVKFYSLRTGESFPAADDAKVDVYPIEEGGQKFEIRVTRSRTKETPSVVRVTFSAYTPGPDGDFVDLNSVFLVEGQELTGEIIGGDIEKRLSEVPSSSRKRGRMAAKWDSSITPARTGNPKIDQWIHDWMFRLPIPLGVAAWIGLALFIHGWYIEFVVSEAWAIVAGILSAAISARAGLAWGRMMFESIGGHICSAIAGMAVAGVLVFYALGHGLGSVSTKLIGSPKVAEIRAVKHLEGYSRSSCKARVLLDGTDLYRFTQTYLCISRSEFDAAPQVANYEIHGVGNWLGVRVRDVVPVKK